MKKILSFLLAFTFLLTLVPFSAFAAEKGKISVTGTPEDFRRGAVFNVEVQLNRNPGFLSFRTEITFDPLVLKVVSVTSLTTLPGFQYDIKDDCVVLRCGKDSGQNLTATGKLARIRFQVKDNAIYGDSQITPVVSQKLYDVVTNDGKAVAFDTVSLPLHLACPHKKTTENVLTKADFENIGTAEEVCADCGLVTQITTKPSLSSEDGKVSAELEVGEYLNSDKKTLRHEYLFGGAEVEKATQLFGDSLIRCFEISFTKNNAPFSPATPTKITLTPDFELPRVIALYVLSGEEAKQIEVMQEDGKITFTLEGGVFVLVSREDQEPTIPETTAPKTTTPPEETKEVDPEEEARKRELYLIGAGVFALVICGLGVIALVRTKQNY